jgi:hypothetical protein
MNKHTLNASANTARPFNLTNGSTLTINADKATIECGKYGLVNIPAGNSGTVILNGGYYKANTDNGSFIKVRTGEITKNTKVNIILNKVNYVDESNDGYIINPVSNDRTAFLGDLNITIDGGSFKAHSGIISKSKANIKEAIIQTDGVGIAIEGGTAQIEKCDIKVGTYNNGAPAVPIAASNNATINVKGCKLSGNGATEGALGVYTSGGTIIAENLTIDTTTFKNEKIAKDWGIDTTNYPDAKILIKVDGETLIEK